MTPKLTDKVAIVTGAGRGVGAAMAQALAAAGARVAVNDINPDRAEAVVHKIKAAGGTAATIVADVSNKFQCVHLVETTRAEWGQLDILVNNAAIMPQSPLLKTDEWEWNRCLEVNLKGPFFMSQLVGRVMADENAERGGVIINVGSTAGIETPLAQRAAYCASKAGLVGLARECARAYAPHNIRVYTLLPTEETEETAAPPDQTDKMAALVPQLCGDDGRFPTGSFLTPDGELSRSLPT